jgi:hypothetical protein
MWIDRAKLGLYGIGCLGALAGNVILSASLAAPDGCWSWGTRYQVHLLPLFAYPAWVGMRDLLRRRIGTPILWIIIGLGLFFQLCALFAPDQLEYSQVIQAREHNPNLPDPCDVVQEHQVAMRLGNIASAFRAVVKEDSITDWPLQAQFGNLWVFRLARDRSLWISGTVILVWLGIFIGAVACLYHSLQRNGRVDGKWVC